MLVYNLNVIENSLLIHKICLFVNRLADVKRSTSEWRIRKIGRNFNSNFCLPVHSFTTNGSDIKTNSEYLHNSI